MAKIGAITLQARIANMKESVSGMACLNAAGEVMPPMCRVIGNKMRSVQSFDTRNTPDNISWTFQESGPMNDVLGPADPQLLML